MQNTKTEETLYKDPFLFKHEDIRAGVAISVANLGEASKVFAGTPIGKDSGTGLYHVIKAAKLYEAEANTETSYKVFKGHPFKANDYITGKGASKAYQITSIDTTNDDYDVINVGTTLGIAYDAGDALCEAYSEDATGGQSSLNHTPAGLVGTTFDIEANNNHLTQMVVRGTVQDDLLVIPVPDKVKTALTHIIFQ